MIVTAVLLDGPLKGRRHRVETDYYGRVPKQIDVAVSRDLTHRYVAAGASPRVNTWNYLYDAAI